MPSSRSRYLPGFAPPSTPPPLRPARPVQPTASTAPSASLRRERRVQGGAVPQGFGSRLVVQAGRATFNRFGAGKRFRISPTQRETLFGDPSFTPERLGCGSFACVYTHSDPAKAVKFTSDGLDAEASTAVRNFYGNGVPSTLIAVHGVYEMIGLRAERSGRPLPRRHWAIVVDRAERPSARERKLQVCVDRHGPDIEQCGAESTGYLNALKNMKSDLRDVGVTWTDIHRGNVMKKDGRWVAVDYGHSLVNPLYVFDSPPVPLAGPPRGRWPGWR